MRCALLAVVSCLWGSTALAAPVVVWLESEVPETRAVRKAESELGEAAAHFAYPDLAYPPQPVSEADTDTYDALRRGILDAKGRWTQFDVEFDTARRLQDRLVEVDVVRDERDLRELTDAYLVQGAAVYNAFSPTGFQDDPEAEPFRTMVPGAKVNNPWLQALSLMPDRAFMASDFVDGATYPHFQALAERVRALPMGYLEVKGLPRDTEVVVDGLSLASGTTELSLPVGDHYVHLLRGGVVTGRQKVFVDAGLTAELPVPVSDAELAKARQLVVDGVSVGFPEDVRTAIIAVGGTTGGAQVFVGAVDEGKVVLQPFEFELQKVKQPLVTFVASGEVGGALVVSTLFDGVEGDPLNAPAAHGSIGFELGISHVAILGGFDLAILPGQTVTYGNADQDDNLHTSFLPQPWGGLGGYVLRPTGSKATLLLAGTYGFSAPAHMALGLRTTLGIPVDDEGTWFRLTVGGSSGRKTIETWGSEEVPMHVLFLRLGFGTRF